MFPICDPVVISSVYPSGGAAATGFTADDAAGAGAILDDHGAPMISCIAAAKGRAMASIGPPGANGTIILIVRSGNAASAFRSAHGESNESGDEC